MQPHSTSWRSVNRSLALGARPVDRRIPALSRGLAEHGVALDLTTNGTLLTPDRVEWIAPIAREVKVNGRSPHRTEEIETLEWMWM